MPCKNFGTFLVFLQVFLVFCFGRVAAPLASHPGGGFRGRRFRAWLRAWLKRGGLTSYLSAASIGPYRVAVSRG
jgi:hypothetical protein